MSRISITFSAEIQGSVMDFLELEQEVLDFYSAADLLGLHKTYLAEFLKNYPQIIIEWGLDSREYEGVYIRKNPLARVLSIIITDQDHLKNWLAMLPSEVVQCTRLIAWEGKRSVAQLEQNAKALILEYPEKNEGNDIYSINSHFCMFQVQKTGGIQGSLKERIFLDLPPVFKTYLKKHYSPPNGYHITPVSLTENALIVFEDNEQILTALPIILAIFKTKKSLTNKRGELTQSSIRQIQNLVSLSEFYDGKGDPNLQTMRIKLIFHMLKIVPTKTEENNSISTVKTLFERYSEIDRFPHVPLLNHVRGWQFAITGMNHDAHLNLLQIIKTLPADGWIEIKQIVRHASLREIFLNPVSIEQAKRYLKIAVDWEGWGNTQEPFSSEKFDDAITLPYIKALIFLYAAFGILDVAYELPLNQKVRYKDRTYMSVFDGLRFTRLTGLGAFVLQQTETYSGRYKPGEKAKVALDEEQLLIFANSKDPLMEYHMTNIAKKVGKNHYAVDFITFLANCDTKRDVEKKVSWLKEQVGSAIPDNWTEFFNLLNSRVGIAEPKSDQLVYKIAKENDDLMHFLVTDEVINRYIKKAENHHIVISKSDLEKVKDRIRKFGFLF